MAAAALNKMREEQERKQGDPFYPDISEEISITGPLAKMQVQALRGA